MCWNQHLEITRGRGRATSSERRGFQSTSSSFPSAWSVAARRSKSHPGCVVLVQVFAFLCTSLLLGVGYSLAVAFGTRSFDFRPMNLLPFALLTMVMLWSIYLYRTNRSKWSKTTVARDGDSTKKIKMEVAQESTEIDESMCKINSGSTFGIWC